jgi:hypothetical protein
MLPMPSTPFAFLWWSLVLVLFLLGPFLLVYCVARFLRDLRRIAVALEYRDDGMPWQLREPKELPPILHASEQGQISNSMFGR